MAKEFDIYLRKHLVECDLLVYSFPYHDGISVTNRLIIDAVIDGVLFQRKYATVKSGIEVNAAIDEMVKWCFEKLSMGVALDTTVDIKTQSRIWMKNDPIIIDVSPMELLGRAFNEINSGLILGVKPLDTQMAISMGIVDLPLIVGARVADPLKRSFLNLRNPIIANAEISQINQLDYIGVDSTTIVDSTVRSLCYNLTFDANAVIEIVALVLGTEIRHSLGVWYNGLTLDADVDRTWAQKFIITETAVAIMQEVTEKFMKVLYPNSADIVIEVSDMNISMKRYRLLEEVDDLTLADIDDMTLDELDYVWLTD